MRQRRGREQQNNGVRNRPARRLKKKVNRGRSVSIMDDFRPPSGHGEGEGVLAKPVRGGTETGTGTGTCFYRCQHTCSTSQLHTRMKPADCWKHQRAAVRTCTSSQPGAAFTALKVSWSWRSDPQVHKAPPQPSLTFLFHLSGHPGGLPKLLLLLLLLLAAP